MAVQGVPKFDAIVLMEISSINFANGAPQLAAKAAFVKLDTGITYGHTTLRNFSQRTQEVLALLRESMENDIAAVLFDGGDAPAVQHTGFFPREPGGLAEALRGETDAESV